jgi:2-amino-4-hydroxy-6-hydroxymethyldihydropteridine diphosphokinase
VSDAQSRLHWRPAYIGIGSNLESPAGQISRAVAAIDQLPGCLLVQRSSNYLSAALGPGDQPDYINAVVAILTTLDAQDLLGRLQAIERDQGRVRGRERWGPRTLDLDLLVFSGDSVDEPNLSVPHPRIGERNFVLLPLAELAPDMRIPGVGTVAAVLAKNDNSLPAIKKL